MPTRNAMEKAGIPVPGLMARDGLAAINGSNLITGIGCLTLYDIERWVAQAEIAAAMTLEALHANLRPYEARLHELLVPAKDGASIAILASIGVAAYGPGHESAVNLLEAADAALYLAKHSGRDRVELALG